MPQARKGDLVYVPSDVYLHRKDEYGAVTDYLMLKKPANLLVVESNSTNYEVLYNKKRWIVEKNKTYGVKND